MLRTLAGCAVANAALPGANNVGTEETRGEWRKLMLGACEAMARQMAAQQLAPACAAQVLTVSGSLARLAAGGGAWAALASTVITACEDMATAIVTTPLQF